MNWSECPGCERAACELDRTSARPYVFDGKGFDDIGNDLIKGMSKEILSLQSLADMLRTQQNEISAKFAEQKPAIEQLTHIWRTIVLGVIGAFIIAIFGLFVTFSIPSVYALGQKFWDYLSNKIQNPQSAAPASTPSPAAAPTPPPTSPEQLTVPGSR